MGSFISRFATLGAILSLSACATTTPNEHYLEAGARQHIKKVDAVLIAKQDEIGADIKQNATLTKLSALASSATFIPVLLDIGVTGVRAANANKMAKPMREKLEAHDFASDFRQQVRQSLAGTTLGGVEDILILRDEYPGLRGELIGESEADAVLLIDMKYAFTPSFEDLYVASHAVLFPNHPELNRFQETPDKDEVIEYSDNIYRNQYGVKISTGLEDATPSEHAAKWAEMSQEQLVEVLDAAALMLADTIANDIAIDDVDSDLDLIPEGYVLNTKYNNLNEKFAKLKSLSDEDKRAVRDSGTKTDINLETEEGLKTASEPEPNLDQTSGPNSDS